MDMELFRIGFISVGIIDLLDICLVAFIFYKVYKAFRNSAVLQVLILLLLAFLTYRIVEILHMELLQTLMGEFLQFGALALVVIFAPELRRLLIGLRRNSIFERLRRQMNKGATEPEDISQLVNAMLELARTRTGSIIVLAGNTDLSAIAQSGDELNADVSQRLLVSIFNPKSPLHDGAVLIKGSTIIAARVVLPVSDDPDLPPELGLRHRSGLGITEISDAAAIISSEETGKISVAYEGRLKRNLSEEELYQFLRTFYNVGADELR